MKSDMNDLKKLVYDLIRHGNIDVAFEEGDSLALRDQLRETGDKHVKKVSETAPSEFSHHTGREDIQDTEEIVEESLSLADKEVEMIKKALGKYNGKRKMAAHELGISERTLYRKIKEYGIEM